MDNKMLLMSVLATALIGISGSGSAYSKEIVDKDKASDAVTKNALQEFDIELKDKGDGSYYFPYNYYNPRHIWIKNTVQQVGLEVSDEVVNNLFAPTSEAAAEKPSDLLNANKQKQGIKHLSYADPVNFDHPAYEDAGEVTSNEDGILEYELNVQYGQHQFKTIQNGVPVTKNLNLRGYNGELVGPTLVVKPGDTLKIRLNNLLPPEDHANHCGTDENCDHHTTPHGFNNTNLHTHGLHVSPSGKSDNVFVKLEPGDSFDYEIHIPEDHSAGTFWYHAHVHGSTTVQVASGVHGAIIVRGDYDEIPAIKKAEERIMILQNIAFDDNGEVEDNENYFVEKWQPEGWDRGWHVSINGQVMPEIDMQLGATELWRFVHAGVREYSNLRLVHSCDSNLDIPLIQLAADGIPFRKKRLADDKGTFLAPGYRSDVMVKARARGVYYLVDASVEGAADLPDNYCDYRRTESTFALDEKALNILARVNVTGYGKLMGLPWNSQLARLNRPAIIEDNELIEDIEYTEFNITPKAGVDPSDPAQFHGANFNFTINDKTYDPDQPRQLKLGTAQTWKLNSAFYFHPYHIHVNPFEIITRDDNGNIIDRYWRDTVLVFPPDAGQDPAEAEIEIRTRYEKFSGAFVMHCHILDHEDRGMMEKVEILP